MFMQRKHHQPDESDMDFVQRLLQWDLRTVREPKALSMLPKQHIPPSTYYKSFIPHIMEESRAVIHQGLEKSYSNPSSDLRLTCDVMKPMTDGNPYIFNFRGRIETKEDNSPYMNVLLLTPLTKDAPKKSLLVIASDLDGTVKAKANVFQKFFDQHRGCFKEGKRWRATYLGCLVTQERMFNACQKGCDDPVIRMIACGTTGYTHNPYRSVRPKGSNLNPNQYRAIKEFAKLPQAGTLLLQGPPGTGKTTTLVKLLQSLHQQRTLVCAASNKAIQVLAERFYDVNPDGALILIGVEDKIPEKLKPISLSHWLSSMTLEIDNRVKKKKLLLKRALGDEAQAWFKRLEAKCKTWNQKYPNRFQIQELSDRIAENDAFNLFTRMFDSESPESYDDYVHFGYKQKTLRELLSELHSDAASTLVEERDKVMENLDATPLQKDFEAEDEHLQRLESRFNIFGLSIEGETAALHAALNEKQELAPDEWTDKLTGQCEELVALSAALRNRQDCIEASLLNGARWIFSTLSTTGRVQLTGGGAKKSHSMTPVDNLVVDEAAQSVEAETLIAFQHRPERVILVGDTQQLPATVISNHAKAKHYDWSMMWRMQQECNLPTLMLNEQYRMHPEICRFPSARWYEGRLQTAARLSFDMVDANSLVCPYAFYNMSNQDNSMRKQGTSSYNTKEANYVAKIVESCRQQCRDKKIGIITFYSAQVEEIQKALKAAKQPHNSKMVRVSSVDGFQGGEADIIILSFVRSPEPKKKKGSIGFLDDFRRLNVALTRAKSTLIMLGHANTLGQREGSDLHALLEDAKRRHRFHEEHVLKERLGLPPAKMKKASGTSDLEISMASLSLDDQKLDPQASTNSVPNPQGKKNSKGSGGQRFFRSQSAGAKRSHKNKAVTK